MSLYIGPPSNVPDIYLGPTGSYPSYNSTGGTAPTFLSDRVRFNPGSVSETSSSCQFVDFGAQTFPMTTSGFSFVCKFQFTGSPGFFERIFCINLENVNPTMSFKRNTTSNILLYGYYNPTQQYLADFGSYAQNTTYTIIGIYNPNIGTYGTLYFYKNGTLTASFTATAKLANFTSTNVFVGSGRTYSADGALNADIFYLSMYKRVLSASEISFLSVNNPFTPVLTTPITMSVSVTPLSRIVAYGTSLFSQLSTAATSSAVGAFSLRAVNGTTARVVQVRNGTTSATADFYADRLGNLLTAPVTGTPIATWLGGATGYVTTWYDQSGRGSHMSCSSTSLQPVIDPVNKWIDFKTSAYFDTSATPTTGPVPYSNTQNYTVICRHNTIGNNNGGICGVSNAAPSYNTTNFTNNFRRDTTKYHNYWFFNDANGGTYSSGNSVTFKWDGTNRYIYSNGSLVTTVPSSNWRQTSSTAQMIGKTTNDTTMNGEMYYLFMFNSALLDADRQLVESLSIS